MRSNDDNRKADPVGSPDELISEQIPDGVDRRTTLLFDPAPTQLTDKLAAYRLVLAPGQRVSIYLAVECEETQHYATA